MDLSMIIKLPPATKLVDARGNVTTAANLCQRAVEALRHCENEQEAKEFFQQYKRVKS